MTQPRKQTLEREIKLRASPEYPVAEMPGEPLLPRTFTSTYYDTDGYRLARHGITLRYRVEAGRGLWQLKLPRNGARWEVEYQGRSDRPPASVGMLLIAHVRGEALKPVAELRTIRKGVRVVENGRPVAEVVLDCVTARDRSGARRRLCELEVELTGGSDNDLHRLEKMARDAGARDGDPRPKVLQILDVPLPAPVEPVPRDARPIDHLTTMLAAESDRLLLHDPGTRLGSDPEALHQMRVATRRIRAYLRAAAPFLDRKWVEPIRAELDWLGSALGRVRDLDVLLEYLAAATASLRPPERQASHPVIRKLQEERTGARDRLLHALESDRYFALLDLLKTAAQSPAATDTAVSLQALARDEYRKLRRAMRKRGAQPSDKTLHKIRIKGKRARYATELAEAAIGKPATRFLRQAKVLQDLLGEHQDAVMCEQRLSKLLRRSQDPIAVRALNRLIERQRERRRRVRTTLPTVWEKLEKRANKIWG